MLLACCPAAAQEHVRFVENKGQWPEMVRFKADVPGATVWCEHNALLIDRYDAREVHSAHAHGGEPPAMERRPVISHHALRLQFVMEGRTPRTRGMHQLGGLHHYFVGNDPDRWGRNARAFTAVEWSSIAPGIALRLTSGAEGLKYDLHVAPGGDAGALRLRYDGPKASPCRMTGWSYPPPSVRWWSAFPSPTR